MNAVFDAIVHSVAKGNRVSVVGFGTFRPRKRKARAGRSPVNGKEIRITSKIVPAFAAGQGFKDAVDRRRSGSDPKREIRGLTPIAKYSMQLFVLFWSELILDLGDAHHPVPAPASLDVTRADAQVRAALAGMPAPDLATVDAELARYARYRGAQARLGRNWRDWPAEARAGTLTDELADADEERLHLVAQTMARGQLHSLRERLERDGARLGLDLAVGVHPDGFDPWSRQHLFGEGMAVGAPPDEGFPSGQDWGFSPVLPSRLGGRATATSPPPSGTRRPWPECSASTTSWRGPASTGSPTVSASTRAPT